MSFFLNEYSWNKASFPSANDYPMVIFFMTMWPLLRLVLDRTILNNVGKYILFHKYRKNFRYELDEDDEASLKKFKESSWKFLYYLSFEIYGVVVICNEPWFGNTAYFWEEWPNQTIKFKLKMYYSAQCGFYMYSVAALLFWETRRKDFPVMMCHHLISICLISYSYINGTFRVGSLILALHDFSDIFLEAAKLFKYSKCETMASITFGLFAFSWLILRLGYFPFVILRSTSVEILKFFDLNDHFIQLLYYRFNCMLLLLLGMHVYWWVLIVRMIWKQVKNAGKVTDDVRSDSEDD